MNDSRGKRDRRLEASRSLRAKAPIAAHFEDCFQAFQQLFDSLKVNESNSELHNIAKDCGLRFKIWGDDSGASSRALDYALRSSPVVKRQTLRLLKDLSSFLEQAIAEARLQDPGDPDAEDGIESTIITKSVNPVNLDDDAAPDDPDAESSPDLCLEEVSDIIGYLVQLLPALRNPLEEENSLAAIHLTDMYSEDVYRQIANMIFPMASRELSQRLGHSNWRRRRNIEHSSDRSKTSETGTVIRRPIKGGPKPWEAQLRWAKNFQRSYSVQHQSTLAESDTRTSTVVSGADTVLTKIPLVDQDSTTSVTDASQDSILQHIKIPDPPVDLAKAEQFDCPYCNSVLPLTFSSNGLGKKDWTDHVFLDLKPYMCTFDTCTYERRLYADKDEWFQHELDFHRSQLIWSCSLCRTDFETSDRLKVHCQTVHPKLSPSQLTLIQETCLRYSQNPLPEQLCTLCGFDCGNIHDLENHLGNHLETYALATLLDDELLEDEGLESYETIADYFAGLSEHQEIDDGTIPADNETRPGTILVTDPVDTNASHLVGSSDPSGLDNTEDDSRRPIDGLWSEKVKTFLDKQTTQDSIPAVRLNVQLRYENFVGRDADLQSIHKHLSTPGRICTVSGRGGIGKTAIAVEYLHKYDFDYAYVFWVEAGAPGICAEKYGMIASSLNLVERPFADEVAHTYFVRESLAKSERRWLLIFDNVGSWADISRYIPRNLHRTKGSVLVTTRSGPMLSIPARLPVHNHQRAVELDVWPLEHGREFLLTSIQPKLNREDLQAHDEYALAEQVVELVGRLPLAISMIVGYVKVSRCTLADFLEMWEERQYSNKGRRNVNADGSDMDIDATIDTIWAIGIREVRLNSRRLLDILSFLDPDTIQKSLLVGDHKEKYLEFLNSSETLSYKRMINELNGRRLLSVKDTSTGEQAYTIHRLLQHKVLLDMEDYSFADAFRKAFRLIRKRFPVADSQQVPDPQDWDTCQEYIPHVFAFCRIYNQNYPLTSIADPEPLELAKLFYDAGFYIWARQTTSYDGFLFLDTATRILDDIKVDPNDKIRADILCLTGNTLSTLGCIERVQGLIRLEQAWQIRQRIYDQDPNHDNDVLLQNAANDYSLCLMNEHRFEEAGKLIRECRNRYMIWGTESENPFENSKYYGNYSTILMWKDEITRAIEFQERAIHLTEKFSGRRNALYYRRVFMLANLLLQAGDIQGALDRHLEVLTARLELHGKHQQHTIMSTYAVGAMYYHMGDLDTATKYILQCIDSVKVSNWDKVAFARAKYHLALLYREQGIEEDTATVLEAEVMQVLDEFGDYAAECVRGADDKMMILDDLQPGFLGRYTGRKLLRHLQKCLRDQEGR